ncbi:MTG1 GTPase, partial [Piaya cayana]|nr:MTG1 GTPase [Piaya cayana]
AHIPLSGRNPLLQEALGIRPHVLVLNKMDLADPHRQPVSASDAFASGDGAAVRALCVSLQIIPLVAELVDKSPRYHRAESAAHSILVIGVPNVGKSSLINSLRRLHLKKGKATAVGGEPGITKAVLTRIQVCEKPLMYLVDTPGVLPPRLGDVETGMKLAVCGEVAGWQMGMVGLDDPRILFQPSDSVIPPLLSPGNVNVTTLSYPAAAYEFLRDFRAGRLGRVTLD